jgi:hypothetical protein
MVRAFGGCNDHPDPTSFLLIYRLMTIYSLVKPSGSNVTGEELFESLLKDCDTSAVMSKLQQWKELRKRIILRSDPNAASKDSLPNSRTEEDEELLQFFGGYVAMKALSFSKCENCSSLLTKPKTNDTTSLIDIRNYYNVLHYPSDELYNLIAVLEDNIQKETKGTDLSPQTFMDITERLTSVSLPLIGCLEHREDVTGYILQFFLILRMQFMCKTYNDEIVNIKKHRELRKMGKLIQGTK